MVGREPKASGSPPGGTAPTGRHPYRRWDGDEWIDDVSIDPARYRTTDDRIGRQGSRSIGCLTVLLWIVAAALGLLSCMAVGIGAGLTGTEPDCWPALVPAGVVAVVAVAVGVWANRSQAAERHAVAAVLPGSSAG